MADFYTAASDPADNSDLTSSIIRAEWTALAAGFAKVAGYTGAGSRVVFINSGATAQTTDAELTYNATTNVLTVNGSTFGTNTSVGGTLGVTGAATLSSTLTYGGVTLTAAVTGTGKMVLDTSPTLVTPTIGVATATSINKVAVTAPATSATLTIADGKTLTASNTLTLSGTDGTTMTFPATSASVARTDAGQTFTGVQVMTAPQLAGTVNLSGGQIQFPATQNASANANTLDDYDEYSGASAACTGAITVSVGWTIVKVGKKVTLSLPDTTGTATAAATFTYATAIPAKYRPAQATRWPVQVVDNGNYLDASGRLQVSSAGVITVAKALSGTGNFTVSGGTAGIESTSVSWLVA